MRLCLHLDPLSPACLSRSVRRVESDAQMKINSRTGPLSTAGVIGIFVAGCSNLAVPPASRYRVEVGERVLEATSIKPHGKWIEVQTDKGPIWINERYVRAISPIQ